MPLPLTVGLRRCCLLAVVALSAGALRGQAGQRVDDDLGPVPRHAALLYPTRLVNAYFPEATLGYRFRPGEDALWGLGATAGAALVPVDHDGEAAGVWGFGLGAEARRYWGGEPLPRFDPYLALGAELSRAYYRSGFGLAGVPGTGYDRVVAAATVSRRHEGLFGLGADFTATSGFVVDVRLAVALVHWDYRAGGDAPASVQRDPLRRERGHETNGFLDLDGDGSDTDVLPRLRVGLGWRW